MFKSIRVPTELHSVIKVLASEDGRSMIKFLEMLIENYKNGRRKSEINIQK